MRLHFNNYKINIMIQLKFSICFFKNNDFFHCYLTIDGYQKAGIGDIDQFPLLKNGRNPDRVANRFKSTRQYI